jgi:hypothetical protein
MPLYTIPSYMAQPGAAYQPGLGVVPLNVKSGARFIGAAYPNLYPFSSTKFLDQSPLHLGTRRAGQQGRCYTADGTDDEVIYGDIGTAIWFSGWVKLNSDNQCLFSLGNDTNTNLIVTAGVLTAGATLTLTGIKVDNVSKTASEAGALLNDNLYHFLSCGIGDGLGGGSTADDVRFFTDGTNHGSVSGFDWRFYSTTPTANELTEAYSGTGARNIAAMLKYALWDKMDTQSGVTSYDSSGNGLTGVLTNITAANFHATQDVWSFQNQVGYNLSGAVYIPRDESDPTNDVLANPLTYTGIRPNDASLINSSCLDLNGTNQAVRVADNTALDITDNLTVSVWAKNDASSLSSTEILIAKYDAAVNQRSYQFSLDAALKLSLRLGDPADGTLKATWVSTNAIAINSINNYSFSFATGVLKFYLNGLEIAGAISSGAIPTSLYLSTTDLTVGSSLSSNVVTIPWDGQIFDARIYAGDSTVLTDAQILSIYEDGVNNVEFEGQSLRARYVCAESAGSGVLDYSGNGNDGTIENAASNWGVTQDVLHANLLEGFSLYEHASSDPIRVKFVNGSPRSFTPPTGYTLTAHYPVGNFRRPAETEVNFNPDSTPEMGGQLGSYTAPASHAFGDDIDPGATDQGFARQAASKEDRFAIFAEAQTGGNLTTIERWTT